MRKRIKRLLLLLVVLALAAVVATWLLLRASVPRLTGDLSAPGLAAPVTIERDSLGTATIRASSHDDVAYALGFVHAQERYFEMDLMRRAAAGELADLFGSVALKIDKERR